MKKEEVLARLESLKAAPKRSLGQNFLTSESVIEEIVKVVKESQAEHLVEIGPGLGSLTEHLLQFPMKSFLLIEMDQAFSEYWRERGLKLIEQDALKFDWEGSSELNQHSFLVSNLPYQISASLVMELSSISRELFLGMVLMFQKEVAERITASIGTKDYGVLSVMAQNRWQIKKVVDAGPACFHPRPQISSRVLRFDFKDSGFGSLQFLKFVKAGFQNRRKQLMKSLKGIDSRFEWEASLEAMGKPLTTRAEEVNPEEWRVLFNEYKSRR